MECSPSPDMPVSKYWKPGPKQMIHLSTTRTVTNGTNRFWSHERLSADGGSVSRFTAGQSAVFVPLSKTLTAGFRSFFQLIKTIAKSNRFVHSWMLTPGGRFGLVFQSMHV